MEFLVFHSPKGIIMVFKDYSRAPIWLRSIKRYGIPKDPESEISALENGGVVYVGWDGKVFALDAEDGSRRWSRTLRCIGLGGAESHQIDMAIQSGFLYATWGDRVFRINLNNGQVLETRRTQAQLMGLWED
jgi:outer membrane protein assembly factor BamB